VQCPSLGALPTKYPNPNTNRSRGLNCTAGKRDGKLTDNIAYLPDEFVGTYVARVDFHGFRAVLVCFHKLALLVELSIDAITQTVLAKVLCHPDFFPVAAAPIVAKVAHL